MIKIIENPNYVELIYLRYKISIPTILYPTFKNNLYLIRHEEKWVNGEWITEDVREKINVEDLCWSNFNLLLWKHTPKYNNPEIKYVDVKILLQDVDWFSFV